MRFFLFILFFFTFALSMQSQESAVVPQRTPEQEAAKQTEKFQQELNLTAEQVKSVYEINLRYARERQQSNTRIQAVVRMKNKNTEIQQVLDEQQKELLQSKRYESTRHEATLQLNRNSAAISTGFRSSSNFRSNSTVRVLPPEADARTNSRTVSSQRTERVAPQFTRQSLLPRSSTPTRSSVDRRSEQQEKPGSMRTSGGANIPQKSEPASRSERK